MIKINMATGVLTRQGRVYIQQRRPDDVWASLWEFPGGVIELGETPEQAVVREFMEETGVEVEVVDTIGVACFTQNGYRVTIHGFHCRDVNDPVKPLLEESVAGFFAKPDELGSYEFPPGHVMLLDMFYRYL